MAQGDLVDSVHDDSGTTQVASLTLTLPGGTPTDGNLIVVVVASRTSASGNPFAVNGTDYTEDVAKDGDQDVAIFSRIASSEADADIVVAPNSTDRVSATAFVFEGPFESSPFDKSATAATGGGGAETQTTGTTATLSQADEVAVGAVSASGGVTYDEGWSNGFTQGPTPSSNTNIFIPALNCAYKKVAATTALETTETWTTARRCNGIIATYMLAAGGAAEPDELIAMRSREAWSRP